MFSFILSRIKHATVAVLFFAFLGFPLFISNLNHSFFETPILRAFKIVTSSFILFFAPGLLLIRLIRIRYRNLFELLGLSFISSISFATILILAGIWLQATMLNVAVAFNIIILVVFAYTLIIHLKEADTLFLERQRLQKWKYDFFLLLLIVVLSLPAYRWGTDIFLNHGEMLLHLAYTINYSTSQLSFMNLGFAKDTPLPNLINLWEALLALWANLIKSDPYEIFFCSRFIATFTGLVGLMWMIRCIFISFPKYFILSCASVLLVFSWFFLMTPSPWDWIRNQESRGIFCFYPLAAHSDTAIDILIPIGCSFFLYNLRFRQLKVQLIFLVFLIATFLWHPREFFQFSLYAFLLWITYVLLFTPSFIKITMRFLNIFIPLLLTATTFFFFNYFFAHAGSNSYDEFAIKKTALIAAFTPKHLISFSHFFNFPNDWIPLPNTNPENPRNIQSFPWLIISAFSLIFIYVAADIRSKAVGVFFILLWFFCLIWSSGTLMCIAFSYSEFIMTSPRILYFFAYLIIPLGFLSFFDFLIDRKSLKAFHFITIFVLPIFFLGLFLGFFWPSFVLYNLKYLYLFLSISIIVCLILFLIQKFQICKLIWARHHHPYKSLSLFAIFFLTFNYLGTFKFLKDAILKRNFMYSLDDESNPFGFSKDLISLLRILPAHKTFLVNPSGTDSVNVYGSFFLAVFPFGSYQTINRDVNICKQFMEGTHVLNRLYQGNILDSQVLEWLYFHNVDFILFRKEDFNNVLSSMPILLKPPYSVVFSNFRDREILFSFNKDIGLIDSINPSVKQNSK